jgi:hypothetical protein
MTHTDLMHKYYAAWVRGKQWRDYFDLQPVLRQLGLPKSPDVSVS